MNRVLGLSPPSPDGPPVGSNPPEEGRGDRGEGPTILRGDRAFRIRRLVLPYLRPRVA
jgi:hypothetical protein